MATEDVPTEPAPVDNPAVEPAPVVIEPATTDNVTIDPSKKPIETENTGSAFTSFLPFILIIFVFYFFMIRPQMRKQKELKNYRSALQKGDKVVTTGGIYGKLSNISDNTVDVEIASGVVIKVDKYAILKDSTDLANQK